MPKKVKKLFGENPEDVVVNSEKVAFDENGEAEVEDDIAEVLESIPGYTVDAEASEEPQAEKEPEKEPEPEKEADDSSEEDSEEDDSEDEEKAEEAPKKKTPAKRKSPARRAPSK
jgi:pyruvate dehydrogenase E2 component (dihydrolipoamide acetyltransferase)